MQITAMSNSPPLSDNDHTFNDRDHVARRKEEGGPGELLPAERGRILRKLDWSVSIYDEREPVVS